MTVPALRFQQVVKRYARHSVLQGVDLEVAQGEFFGLVGVNGAGKTSLIKCLFDFCAVDGGSIEIFDQPHSVPAARAPLAFLPERFIPPYYLNGADFLRYVLSLQGLAYEPAAVDAMLAALDLAPAALSQTVRQYSKGMTQKLGLAACFLARKPMYILDEPMSGLDPKARALFKQQLQRTRDQGSGLFFTSHTLADVEELCDRMAILHQGRIAFVGTPAECRSRYAASSLEQAFMTCIQ
ncbi:ABC transporter ATP-binding protein [Oxalobacteraceae bacterium]|nr:ABC transporter ATP-binding protein [Oxalobacteraceae bacterium]